MRRRHRNPRETRVAVASVEEAEAACGAGFHTDTGYLAREQSGVEEKGAVAARIVAGGILEAVRPNCSSTRCAAVGLELPSSWWLPQTHTFHGKPDGSFGVAAEEGEGAVALSVAVPPCKLVGLAESEADPPEVQQIHCSRRQSRPNVEASCWRRPPTECPSLGKHWRWRRSGRVGPRLPSSAGEERAIAAPNNAEVAVAAGAPLTWRPPCSSSSYSLPDAAPPRRPIYP